MNGRKYADGAAKIVWIDLASGRSVPLPEQRRRAACARSRRARHDAHDDHALAAVAGAHRAGEHHRFARRVARASRRARSPTTRRSGAGRPTSARRSGARSGTTPASSATRGERTLVDGDRMPGARWFPDARLNFAREPARAPRAPTTPAMRSCSAARTSSRAASRTRELVARGVARRRGAEGAWASGRAIASPPTCPTCPRRSSRCWARRACGAIWSSCSPDFGVQGVLDRFGQIEPRVLFAVDGYWYNGKPLPILDKVAAIVARLPTSSASSSFRTSQVTGHGPQDLSRDPRRRPLGRVRSRAHARRRRSSTRGCRSTIRSTSCIRRARPACPKCIVHGAGGTLLQHLKEHLLHGDVKPGDRLFYFTTCGWMMWNWLASGPRRAARRCCSTTARRSSTAARVLWDFADAERMTHFGTSAKYIDAQKKIGVVPRKDFALAHRAHDVLDRQPAGARELRLRLPVREGRPLPVVDLRRHRHRLLLRARRARRCRCGAASCSAAASACDVDVFDDDGKPIRGQQKGELVCTAPFPSMPVGFWNDPDGAKYRAAYFERFPGVWCHGDYVELTEHDGLIIYGRSDATLNPGGVRIGTAEIYRQVEQLPEVVESLVIGQDWPPGEVGDVRVVLFVRLQDGVTLDERARRPDQAAHPRQHDAAPRAGQGRAGDRHPAHQEQQDRRARGAQRRARPPVKNVEALANPEALEQFRDREELKTVRCGAPMNFIAILAALGLEQWRAFDWRAARRALVRPLRALARAQAQRRHAPAGRDRGAWRRSRRRCSLAAVVFSRSPTPCIRCSASSVNVVVLYLPDGIPPLQPRALGDRGGAEGGRPHRRAARARRVARRLDRATCRAARSRASRSSAAWSMPTGRYSPSLFWFVVLPGSRGRRALSRGGAARRRNGEAVPGVEPSPLAQSRAEFGAPGARAALAARLDSGAPHRAVVRDRRRLRGRGRLLAHAGGALGGAGGRRARRHRARERRPARSACSWADRCRRWAAIPTCGPSLAWAIRSSPICCRRRSGSCGARWCCGCC